MQRHDLLRIAPSSWQVMLGGRPDLAKIPLVAGWALREWPVIVRRRMPGDVMGQWPTALPLPPSHGKHRISFGIDADDGVTALPPVTLRDAASSAPAAWAATIAALLALGEEIGAPPRVFGALLWQHATGLHYLGETSDLDLLWKISDQHRAARLVEALERIECDGPVRLDGEVELPDGAGVNWREVLLAQSGSGEKLLVKTLDGIGTRDATTLFSSAPAT